jgi:hypothetical protein
LKDRESFSKEFPVLAQDGVEEFFFVLIEK